MSEIRRRDLLIVVGALLLAPLSLVAQVPRSLKRVGALIPFEQSDAPAQRQLAAFRGELKRLGWIEGQNVSFDIRWIGGDSTRFPAAAKALVAAQPDIIFSRTTPITVALSRETQTIPIVFAVVSDPVGERLVKTLAHPGGNVTGFTNVESSLGGKWIALAKELDPHITRVMVLFDPDTAPGRGAYYLQSIEKVAASVGVTITAAPVHSSAEIERAISSIARQRNGAIVVPPDVTLGNNRKLIRELAARNRLVTVYGSSYFADDGGLIAYGVEYLDMYRRAAAYVDRILRGARADELPVQAPTTFELVLNLKTARALKIEVPPSILTRVDRLIE